MNNLYFAQSGGDTGPIKIGISRDVEQRLASLRTGNAEPVRMLAAFEHRDAALIEKALHAEFHDSRMEGEWFKFDKRITDLICAIEVSRSWDSRKEPPARALNRAGAVLEAIRQSATRTKLHELDWHVVEWSERQRGVHVTSLIDSMSFAHRQIISGEGRPGDYLIVAICETYDEAIATANAIEPWLRTMHLLRRLNLDGRGGPG